MATFIAISGPSTSGKTSLINSLSTYSQLSQVVFSQDMQDKVWSDLVATKLFTEFTEITSDNEYLYLYISRMVTYYNEYLDAMEKTDKLVILDGCWVDLAIYSVLNMWYTRLIKPLQEQILFEISRYDERISKIYLTKVDDEKYPVDKFRLRGKMSTFRTNRPLEIRYYDIAKNLKNTTALNTSDVSEASSFILEDLAKLGYLQ